MAEAAAAVVAITAGSGIITSLRHVNDLSFTDNPTLQKIWRKVRVTALDKVLRDLINRTGEAYDVYMGTLDAMNDNLIAEALLLSANAGDGDGDDGSIIISADQITQAMFACEESRDFLRQALGEGVKYLNEAWRERILDVLLLGLPLDYRKFACALFGSNYHDGYEVGKTITALDTSDYIPVPKDSFGDPSLLKQHGRNFFSVYKHLEGVYRIEFDEMNRWAIVPHPSGVTYFVHKDCIAQPSLASSSSSSSSLPQHQPLKTTWSLLWPWAIRQEPRPALPQQQHLSGTRRLGGQKTVDELVRFGCDQVTAWRLLTTLNLDLFQSQFYTSSNKNSAFPHAVDDDGQTTNTGIAKTIHVDDLFLLREKLIQSFQIISGFRTELHKCVQQVQNDLALNINNSTKRLMGTKKELRQLHQVSNGDIWSRFALSKNAYTTAQQQTRLYYSQHHHHPQTSDNDATCWTLEPFSAVKFLDLDTLDTHMKLLDKLIEKAKTSDLNRGLRKQAKSQFNARTVAVLAAINGNKVLGSMVTNSNLSRGAQYFYQNDDDTKSLCTPFSKLIIFATTNYEDVRANPVQGLEHEEVTLNSWIALRAALEYDIHAREFRYGTPEFQHANMMVSESLATFVQDTTRRFTEWFESSSSSCSSSSANNTISVSYLTELCDCMVTRTGASSPWLVREMVSRCIALGATVVSAALKASGPCDSYGKMERTMKERAMSIKDDEDKQKLFENKKKLLFDCKVNIRNVHCHVLDRGTVILLQRGQWKRWEFEVLFQDQERTSDASTAIKWLERSRCHRIMEIDNAYCVQGEEDDDAVVVSGNTIVVRADNYV